MKIAIILIFFTLQAFAQLTPDERNLMLEVNGPAVVDNFLRSPVLDTQCDPKDVTKYPIALSARAASIPGLKTFCKKNLLVFTAFHVSVNKTKKENLGRECRREVEVCQKLDEKIQVGTQLVNLLVKEMGRDYRLSDYEMSCLPQPAEVKNIEDLIKIMVETRKKAICEPATVDKPLVVTAEDGTPSSIDGNYTLKKDPDGNYTALVNINFQPANAESSASGMEQKVRDCYAKASPYLLGPNGEKLNLQLVTPRQARVMPESERPPEIKINVFNKIDRQNDASYAEDISCDVIIHEGLHLLGLVDEYEERKLGYNCRFLPKSNTVMNTQSQAFNQVLDRTLTCDCPPTTSCGKVLQQKDPKLEKMMIETTSNTFETEITNKYCKTELTRLVTFAQAKLLPATYPIIRETVTGFEFHKTIMITEDGFGLTKSTCTCSPSDDECNAILPVFASSIRRNFDNPLPAGCPYGSRGNESNDRITGNPAPYSVNGNSLRISYKAKNKSLIAPAHFEKILSGACPTKARRYNECASWAYKSDSCAGRPTQCEDESYYLGIRQ